MSKHLTIHLKADVYPQNLYHCWNPPVSLCLQFFTCNAVVRCVVYLLIQLLSPWALKALPNPCPTYFRCASWAWTQLKGLRKILRDLCCHNNQCVRSADEGTYLYIDIKKPRQVALLFVLLQSPNDNASWPILGSVTIETGNLVQFSNFFKIRLSKIKHEKKLQFLSCFLVGLQVTADDSHHTVSASNESLWKRMMFTSSSAAPRLLQIGSC